MELIKEDLEIQKNLQVNGKGYMHGGLEIVGDIGIGTSTPTAKLEIQGGGERSIDLIVNGRIQSKNDEGGLWINGNRFVGGHSTNKLGLWNGRAWRLTVQENGNVGIGTHKPTTTLEIQGKGKRSIDLIVNGRIQSKNNEGGLWINGNRFVGGHSTDKLGLWNGSAWRLTVQKNGNVGIGTTKPLTALHVHGNRIRVSNPSIANHHIDIRADGSALDIESSKDLYLNNNGNKVLVRNFNKVSSRKYKKDIQTFSTSLANNLLKLLRPVKYNYKNDKNDKPHLGFIAEELPDEIAAIDKASVDPMDIIAILCKVVQEHQLLITQLSK